MENDRLAQAIARIDAAATRIAEVKSSPAPAPDGTALQALREEMETLRSKHAAEIDERERALTKLRADAADIDKLKDEEISRLRADIQKQADLSQAADNQTHDADLQALQQKYDRLHSAASAVLGDLDSIISTAEPRIDG